MIAVLVELQHIKSDVAPSREFSRSNKASKSTLEDTPYDDLRLFSNHF